MAPKSVADAFLRRLDELGNSLFTQGQVTATTATTATVTTPDGGSITALKFASCSPAVGDMVRLSGSPGSWTVDGVLGASSAGSSSSTVPAHTHSETDVSNLQTDLNGKAAASHTHAESDITGLTSDLANKAGISHQHGAGDVTSGTFDVARIPVGSTAATVAAGNDARLSDARAWSLYSQSATPTAGQIPVFSTSTGTFQPGTVSGGTSDSVVRAALFGAAGNTETPVCEYQLTTAYSGLAAGDYFLNGNCSSVVYNFTMFSSANSNFYTVTLPYAGRWNVEWQVASSAQTGVSSAKVLLNVPAATTAGRVGRNSYSIMTNNATPNTYTTQTTSPADPIEGTAVAISRSRVFAANDVLSFELQSSVTFSLPVTTLGGIRTRFCVRWVGPK